MSESDAAETQKDFEIPKEKLSKFRADAEKAAAHHDLPRVSPIGSMVVSYLNIEAHWLIAEQRLDARLARIEANQKRERELPGHAEP